MKTIKFIVGIITAVTLISCNGQEVTNKPLKTQFIAAPPAITILLDFPPFCLVILSK